ncbi:DUF3995 domain-containing protein [Aquimarina muelleri]|uniref:DUF3995 domain-containing protein n=1 Tax=Aquimarina muelleri TaxID=279356 RepID=A0A918JV81_9FLAO|nr:DUF3995 domain-containing protein [Aquimarina muelleri]MCX2763984.1 DUF3995 domain-containing protein [Aquimarina muelleri]GGX22068.1 hypothetical protein GCM10007384_24090 [Aquimarina muelleri]
MILSILLSIILFILAGIHFNWVIGGKFGFDASLPTKEDGTKILNPKKTDSAIVAIGLTLFGSFYVLQSGLVSYELSNWIYNILKWIIPFIFILRAIGDFKYIGFFKKITQTKFGKLDARLFSPLCLVIGVISILLAY